MKCPGRAWDFSFTVEATCWLIEIAMNEISLIDNREHGAPLKLGGQHAIRQTLHEVCTGLITHKGPRLRLG